MKIDRRKVLGLLGLGAGGPAAAQSGNRPAGRVSFRHGVASGDPLADRVILWTRLTPENPGNPVAYSWRLTPVDRRAGGAKTGRGATGPERDYTVKVDVAGLDPGRAYTFVFESGGATSPIGRTRTLPKGPTKDVVLAVASCALYPNGYFNAYQAIADLPRVDAVLHLGDYIYEYGGIGSYGSGSPVAAQRPHDPPHECLTLNDYRRRHAQYKSDAQCQAAHARAPWIVVWDDHETANDSFAAGAQNHQANEGDWNLRKAAAIKAYYEWMPIREPAGGGFAINRSFDFGDVASLFMLETRLTARDQQLRYGRDLPENATPEQRAAFEARLNDPARKMMSPSQEAWLAQGLAASVGAGRAWQVLGNEVIMARTAHPPLRRMMGETAFAAALASQRETVRYRAENLSKAGERGLAMSLDQWDGYPADRQRLYALIRKARANVVVLSGDSHAFWANELFDEAEGGTRVAVELGTTSITSPGDTDAFPLPLAQAITDHNREVLFNDQSAKGFLLLTMTKAQVRAEMVTVSTILEPRFRSLVSNTFVVTPGKNAAPTIQEVG